MSNHDFLETFVKRIFVILLSLFVLTSIVGEASPLRSLHRRQKDQIPVPDADIREFKLWVKYASAAYCDVTDWKCGKACSGETAETRLIKFFTKTGPRDNNGYVAINDKEKAIIVSYRGTANVQGFINDIQFNQISFDNPKFKNAKVHFGFLATYNDTRKEITKLIKDLVKENPDYKVISTGHSLGGSLAVFQTLDLIGTPGLNPSNLLTYTYGEPRTGNKDFADFVKNTGYKFFRVVNENDIIPHLPPQDFKYDHYGPEFWVDP
ncbi:312_t:CDS:2 [Funneliformis mosseae]|uniref:312_t:CDS:1 n=1 Tax=Funneliformis mosseae TaxID=27381 RepID=A0A9N9AY46_FUNMO|nr:312_t:CDS:2 [Funneliformis mosseae]